METHHKKIRIGIRICSEVIMDISIIIVSYNTKDILKACLQSVIKSIPKHTSCEIIVVDNNSADGSSDMIAGEFSKVILIKNPENLGFTKANNIGVAKSKGRYVLFLNSDTVIYEDTLVVMHSFMEDHSEAGTATCRVVLPNGSVDDAAHRGFPTPWNAVTHFSGLSKLFPKSKLFSGYSLGYVDMRKPHEIDALAGAFMLVRREAGEQVGWWDESFFWYGDDLDFCYRLKEKGWEIYYVPQVSILHYKGVSGGIKKASQHLTSATKETRIRATKARFEAMRIFYRKHYLKKYPKFVTWLIEAGIKLKEISA